MSDFPKMPKIKKKVVYQKVLGRTLLRGQCFISFEEKSSHVEDPNIFIVSGTGKCFSCVSLKTGWPGSKRLADENVCPVDITICWEDVI